MKRKIPVVIIALLAGIFLGWLIFQTPGNKGVRPGIAEKALQSTIWTCSMHPEIRALGPGNCPLCGMELIPLVRGGDTTSIDPEAIQLSNEAVKLAGISTIMVAKHHIESELYLYGKVQADERSLQSQVSYVPGRIEKLTINYTGETVKKGQVLAEIYSPQLIAAQQELLEAAELKESQPAIYEAAREKLSLMKITENQISAIEKSGVVKNTIEITSNTSGIVTSRRVSTGDYVSQGSVLFEVTDLSKVWVLFDGYESDLPFLKNGEKISFTFQSLPGREFGGKIGFIDPVIDPVTRVAKVRVETGNPEGKLKPEMFATGKVYSNLSGYSGKVSIPKSAVLCTGKRSVVFVKLHDRSGPAFRMREIELGPRVGEGYVVISGLTEGEEVVANGTFSVDAAAQLEGKPSMMNRKD